MAAIIIKNATAKAIYNTKGIPKAIQFRHTLGTSKS